MEVKDKPLITQTAINILRNTHWKRRFNASLNGVVTYVTEEYEKRGGTFLNSHTTKAFVKRALDALEQDGLACNISKNIWEFPKHGQRLFGKGTQWVYLYYYDTYKRDALQQGRNVWNCKIGYAEKNPEKTIQAQKKEAPEKKNNRTTFENARLQGFRKGDTHISGITRKTTHGYRKGMVSNNP